jgi:hypothetical protein
MDELVAVDLSGRFPGARGLRMAKWTNPEGQSAGASPDKSQADAAGYDQLGKQSGSISQTEPATRHSTRHGNKST